MTYKYRYLGGKGIFLEGKPYSRNDIVETTKPLEELDLESQNTSMLSFKDLTRRDEKIRVKHEIEEAGEYIKLIEKEKDQELRKLEAKYDLTIKHAEDEKQRLERIWKEQFEPRIDKPKKEKKMLTEEVG